MLALSMLSLCPIMLQSAKRLRIAAMVQDLADSMLALNDIRGAKAVFLALGSTRIHEYACQN